MLVSAKLSDVGLKAGAGTRYANTPTTAPNRYLQCERFMLLRLPVWCSPATMTCLKKTLQIWNSLSHGSATWTRRGKRGVPIISHLSSHSLSRCRGLLGLSLSLSVAVSIYLSVYWTLLEDSLIRMDPFVHMYVGTYIHTWTRLESSLKAVSRFVAPPHPHQVDFACFLSHK